MCKINTANYNNCRTENGISISGDRGKKVGFTGRCLPMLAPKKEFWQVWHDNIGKIPEEENTKYYATEYYKQVLSKLDPEEVYDMIPEGSILLCYEDNMDFCHRHLFAFWLELFLEIKTSEVYENPNRETLTRLKRPDYLKDIMKEVIEENYEMQGFDNIKEAYEYNKTLVNNKNDVKKLEMKLTS
jgi:hypothetical protein